MEIEKKVDDDDGGYTPPAVPSSPTSTPSNSLESTKSPPPPPTPIEEVRTPSEPQPALMTDEKDMAVDNNIDNKVSDTEGAEPSTTDNNLG